jgi:ubiquitin C-terminal hydrolase
MLCDKVTVQNMITKVTSSPTIIHRGFANFNNKCFSICIINVLLSLITINQHLSSFHGLIKNNDCPILKSLCSLNKSVSNPITKKLKKAKNSEDKNIKIICTTLRMNVGNCMEDASEFFNLLLDRLEEEYKKLAEENTGVQNVWKDLFYLNNFIVDYCEECKHEHKMHNGQFVTYKLNVPTEENESFDLLDCLKLSQEYKPTAEVNEGIECEKCKKRCGKKKEIFSTDQSTMLVISCNRVAAVVGEKILEGEKKGEMSDATYKQRNFKINCPKEIEHDCKKYDLIAEIYYGEENNHYSCNIKVFVYVIYYLLNFF